MESKKACECDLLKEDQEGFKNWEDFYNFKNQVANNSLLKVIIGENSLNFDNEPANPESESWFECIKCGVKRCLHMPAPPFDGEWIKATWRQ